MTPSPRTLTAVASTRRPGWRSWALFSPLLGWLALFVVAPTVILAVFSFLGNAGNSQVERIFTVGNYRQIFDFDGIKLSISHYAFHISNFTFRVTWFHVLLPTYLAVFARSAWYAAETTILCAVIGYPVAYYIGRSPPGRRNALLLAVMIPFLTSFLIRTFAWTTILDQYGVLNTFLRSIHVIPNFLDENFEILRTQWAVKIALVYTYLPFMILPIYGSVEKLDVSLIEAASDLGAGPIRAFIRVILPLTLPGVWAGVLMVFVPAVAMFAVTHIMSGGTIFLIGDVIENQFGAAGNVPLGSALGMLLLAAFSVTFFLFTRRNDPAALA